MFGVKRLAQDGLGDHWRRLHRSGHNLYKRLGGDLDALRRRAKFRWAGHLARCENGILHDILRTRSLSWWRFFQHPTLPLHQGRIGRPQRWEGELEDAFGRAAVDNPLTSNVGWMAAAMERHSWREFLRKL